MHRRVLSDAARRRRVVRQDVPVSQPRRTPGAESGRRLLATLTAFTPERPTPTVAELAETVGVPASTAYRYVALLREVGLVEPAGEGNYRLADRVVTLAAAARAAGDGLAERAADELRVLRDAVGETVLIARRAGTTAYCIAREESAHPVRLQFAVGQAMPLHSGSAARVLLAAMPRLDRTRYVDDALPTLPTDRHALLADDALDTVNTAGFTESYEEVDTGIWGAAAAITRGPHGPVVAALGTAGPLFRLPEDRRATIVSSVREAARRLSAMLA
jgi:DNA-binding IclR family transcriptional regulator